MENRIGEIFLKKRIINDSQLELALHEQVQTGEFLGEILIRLGYAKETDVLKVLAEQAKTRFVNLSEVRINPKVSQLVPSGIVLEHQIMPIDVQGEVLLVATHNPLDIWPLSQLQEQMALSEVQFVLASKDDIRNHIEKYFKR